MTSPPREVYGQRVRRYAGDTQAAWEAGQGEVNFQGSVMAVALCDDVESGGVKAYCLYESGWAADLWFESLEDALEGMAEADESAFEPVAAEGTRLTWVEVTPE